MRALILAILLLFILPVWAGATPPSVTRTIDPTVTTWTEDWSNNDWWVTFSPISFALSNIHTDGTMGNYLRPAGGGSPQKRWDRNKPITARLRLRNQGANWIGFSLFAGEAEYWGFSISSGSVSHYNNAAYYGASNSFTAAVGAIVELQIEFDGDQTTTYKARAYDPADTAAWTTIGTRTFKPKVHPSLQINHEGGANKVDYGQIKVTGSEVWQTTDVPDRAYWLPVAVNQCIEWGIEFELASTADRGQQHFLTHAGGHTIRASTDRYGNGGTASWDQTNLSTDYTTGTFSYQSTTINPASGFKYGTLELIGGLRSGGAGASLSVSLRKSDGTLVPSSDLKGAANPVTFSSSLAEVKTLDLSDITYTGLYFDVDGNSPNVTTHVSPTTTTGEGLTGPPILKQAAVTFVASGTPAVTPAVSRATMRATFR